MQASILERECRQQERAQSHRRHLARTPGTVDMSFKEYNPTRRRTTARVMLSVEPMRRSWLVKWTLGALACDAAGLKPGDTVAVMYGDGEHHNKVRFRKSREGYKLHLSRPDLPGSARRLSTTNVPPLMVKKQRPSTSLAWRKVEDGKTIEVDLPDDFYMQFQDVKRA